MRRPSARSRLARLGVPALLVLPFAAAGCLPPTNCTSVLDSGTSTYCDGGPWTDVSGVTHAVVVAGYAPGPFGSQASLSFGATESANAHVTGGLQWTFVENDPDGTAEGFGPGVFDTASGELSIEVASPTGTVTVTSGVISITRFELTTDPERVGQVEHLTATFEVETSAGPVVGYVRIR